MLKAIQTFQSEYGFKVSVRSAFIETGYNFLYNPDDSKWKDFIESLRKDPAEQKIKYEKNDFKKIVSFVLEKINREWKIKANVSQLIDAFSS